MIMESRKSLNKTTHKVAGEEHRLQNEFANQRTRK